MEVESKPLLRALNLPDDSNKMNPRRVVFSLMACSPLLLTLAIGIHARASEDPFEFVSADKQHHEQVMAYAPIVRRVAECGSDLTASEAQLLALEWIAKTGTGDLVPLEPAFFEDTPQEGIKAQILEAHGRLVNRLLADARSRRAESMPADRAERLLVVMSLSETLKYSDFSTVFQANRDQGRALEILKDVIPNLDAEKRASIGDRLKHFRFSDNRMEVMTQVTRRLYAEARRRKGIEPLGIEEAQRTVELMDKLRDGDRASLKLVTRPLYASNEDAPRLLTDYRLAWASAKVQEKLLDDVIAQLNGS